MEEGGSGEEAGSDEEAGEEDEDDIDKEYNFSTYDDEDEDKMGQLSSIKDMTMFLDPKDDPLLARSSDKGEETDEDEKSEQENHMIKPNDNLVAIARFERTEEIDSWSLEVHVYNEEEDSYFPHHDNLLANFPVCMEWLNYDPTSEEKEPANLVAIGNIDNFIEVWDLDQIATLEPTFVLGKISKKAKGHVHKGPVVTLSWNKKDQLEHFLASGSADGSVVVWDMGNLTSKWGVVKRVVISEDQGVVNHVRWHPITGTSLLAATSKGAVYVINCLEFADIDTAEVGLEKSKEKWLLTQIEGAEIERVLWVPKKKDSDDLLVLVSTDKGQVVCVDPRKPGSAPLWSISAHDDSCEGLQVSRSCPGLLVTASKGGVMAVWDAGDSFKRQPGFVTRLNPAVGRITTLEAGVEQPFVFLVGGDRLDNTQRVWDIRSSLPVRRAFCPRMGLPTDEEEEDAGALSGGEVDSGEEEDQGTAVADVEDKIMLTMKEAFDEEMEAQNGGGARVKAGKVAKPKRARKKKSKKPKQAMEE